MTQFNALLPALISTVGLTGYLYLRSLTPELSRDVTILASLLRILTQAKRFIRNQKTVADMFEEIASQKGDALALHFLDTDLPSQRVSFRQLQVNSNKVAEWAAAQGLRAGDVVVLDMENRPEFITLWLGLCKIGVISSLVNYNLQGSPLRHSFAISKAKLAIVGIDMVGKVREIRKSNDLASISRWFSIGGEAEGFVHLNPILDRLEGKYDKSLRSSVKSTDDIFYIFTSGTTGLPKAAGITHVRYYASGHLFGTFMGVKSSDVMYSALPLYHSAANIVGLGTCWAMGIPFTFRRKFSATSFWHDVSANNCTVIQYIGELCRYLLMTPPTPYDTAHNVRLAIGNGLRPDIWEKFQKRFQIQEIGEFYSATEANIAFFNRGGPVGSIGFLTPLLQKFFPAKVVKFDIVSEQPIRGPDGLCIEAAPGEPGELVAQIIYGDPARHFRGYTDPAATEKKILRNVMQKGDSFFRTGDLLRKDKDGNLYFVDRIGDTFRWKGENVSTNEVAEVISVHAGVKEVNVYGVSIPHFDGRAGMALIVPADPQNFDLEALYKHITSNLPSYAAPLFIRIGQEMDVTSTFKHKKVDLVDQGFNPFVVKDPLFFRDDIQKRFVPLDHHLYKKITSKANL
eukprot:TRINITY_DN2132_c0_g1_i1.p1 TRINITY_DN2132_c0_g1~~TRINITY_DN2132_c0_g1_i1.p1  ORF type:complete len:627 (-),score=128.17 TRINITY_DN2132_c0_g1_i1:170-2050(-)